MELPILDQNNREEQKYYPPPNYECFPENNRVQEDDYFIDETVVSPTDDKRNKYFRRKITRNNTNSFIIRELNIIKYMIYGSFILAIIFPVIFLITQNFELINIIMTAVFLIALCISPICLGCKYFHLIYLELESNSIILTKKQCLIKKLLFIIWEN